MAAAKESIPATGPSIPNIRKFKGTISISTKAPMNIPGPIETLLAFFLDFVPKS